MSRRPALGLAAILGVAALACAWGANRQVLEIYYAGAIALAAAAVALARPSEGSLAATIAAVALAAALVPAVASASLTANRRGPFDRPFQPSSVTAVTQQLTRRASHPSMAAIAAFEQFGQGPDIHSPPTRRCWPLR